MVEVTTNAGDGPSGQHPIAGADVSHWQVPAPDNEERILGGVAVGVAREVGVDPLWVRLAFVVLFAVGGWGALVYLVAWGLMAQLHYLGRSGTSTPTIKGRSGRHRLTAVALITLGLIIFFANLPGASGEIMWPLGILGGGMLMVWRQLDQRHSASDRFRIAQIVGGLAIVLAAVALLVSWAVGSPEASTSGSSGLVAGIAVAVGLVAVSAPWWWRMVQDLDQERQARVRSDERAEVAAHLHDSVLQTLTLIQRHGDDPQTMRNLARRQERELRNWLDPARADRGGLSVRGQLDDLATSVEELHGVPVEVVVVGDCLLSEGVEAALAAAREAAVNAAKHSGADHVDVYVEVRAETLEIFVRDTGSGFDPERIGTDRRGITESIEGRMARAGGSAKIVTDLGAGTEVELTVPRPPDSSDRPEPQAPEPQAPEPQAPEPQAPEPQAPEPQPPTRPQGSSPT